MAKSEAPSSGGHPKWHQSFRNANFLLDNSGKFLNPPPWAPRSGANSPPPSAQRGWWGPGGHMGLSPIPSGLHPSISIDIHQYPSTSIDIHQYPPISINIQQYLSISIYINQYPPIPINIQESHPPQTLSGAAGLQWDGSPSHSVPPIPNLHPPLLHSSQGHVPSFP